MSGMELFEIWLIALSTIALFSFLYKDNPMYKLAEHIFAGLSAGYYVGLIWDTVILQQLWDPMLGGKWTLAIPGILGFLMFTRFFKNFSWISRIPLALVMATTAGIFITSQLHGLVLPQMKATMMAAEAGDRITEKTNEFGVAEFMTPAEDKTSEAWTFEVKEVAHPVLKNLKYNENASIVEIVSESGPVIEEDRPAPVQAEPNQVYVEQMTVNRIDTDGETIGTCVVHIKDHNNNPVSGIEVTVLATGPTVDIFGLFLTIIVIVGVISTLIYFYFSKEHVGALGVTAKVGIWFIMIAFGAHFGYTVMGRVSLLIGRVQFLWEDWIGSFL